MILSATTNMLVDCGAVTFAPNDASAGALGTLAGQLGFGSVANYTQFADLPKEQFRAPPGVRWKRIDRRSGQPVYGAWPSDDPLSPVIWEAFKPETETIHRTVHNTTPVATPTAAATTQGPSDSDFLQRQGGIY